jgi:hypothetical protein
MKSQPICRQARERLVELRGGPLPAELQAHLDHCASCRAEALFEAALGRAVADLPAPEADLASAVLRQIDSRPAPAILVVQGAVLLVLGLCLSSLVVEEDFMPSWPDASWLPAMSAQVMRWLGTGAEMLSTAAEGLAGRAGLPLELIGFAVAALIAANLGLMLRPPAAGGQR